MTGYHGTARNSLMISRAGAHVCGEHLAPSRHVSVTYTGRAWCVPPHGDPLQPIPSSNLSTKQLRQIAFDERAKFHDLVMQGIEAVLRKSPARNDGASWNRAEFPND